MSTDDNTQPTAHEHDDRPLAVHLAQAGATAWRTAARAQQETTPWHADFYRIAAELVETFAAIRALAQVMTKQVTHYAETRPGGEQVYDDTGRFTAEVRLHDAALDLRHLAQSMDYAHADADRFFSSIGHIGTIHPGTTSGSAVGS